MNTGSPPLSVLITAGNTLVPIDRVRGITNIFTGRTGAAIASEASRRGHAVTLLTSHPEALAGYASPSCECVPYRTFDELRDLMCVYIGHRRQDVIMHSAAVSDYRPAGVFAAAPGTQFDTDAGAWRGAPAALVDRAAAKVKSDESELWLRLVRAPKLVDLIRREWNFRGILVKFKLEVAVTDTELLARAERSRKQSDADWMVANTLEGAAEWAYLGSAAGYERISRGDLALRIVAAVERQSRGHHG
jgi:phosphopantothenoylcysteine synthetase/decarboxylase